MKTSRWDAADYLETPEDVAFFINAAFEDGDPIVVKHAIGTAARSKGMAAIAEEANLNRTQPAVLQRAKGFVEFGPLAAGSTYSNNHA